MRIIKKFEDPEFSKKVFYNNRFQWFWGLGDDGRLYANYTNHNVPGYWHRYPSQAEKAKGVLHFSFKEMQRIINEFDKLLIFI